MPLLPEAATKKLSRLYGLCAITPSEAEAGAVERAVLAALQAGVRWIQFRRKSGAARLLYEEALRLREITARFSATLIINDYPDLALAVDADGVHLGQDDLPLSEAKKIMGDKIIGISTHNLEEALDAQRGGADYIGFGCIFPTTTKDAGIPKGPGAIRRIAESVSVPVIAIGGITKENVREVFDAGCHGVAVSSGIFVGDVTTNVSCFLYNIPK